MKHVFDFAERFGEIDAQNRLRVGVVRQFEASTLTLQERVGFPEKGTSG